MTERENQIYKWIKENPLISQDELAAKAGITRSSVAVHISNLMHKGYIQGRGYITGPTAFCTVVGGVNIDIGGRPSGELISKDSNPGQITFSLGGVGRNIAHNMSLLGLKVKMITALGEDDNARRITESCNELGIDISSSLHTSEDSTSTYLFISERDGDMSVAVSDMNIYRHLTPGFIESRMNIINSSELVIVDTNIPEDTIGYLVDNCEAPIYVDPVSCTKAQKLLPYLEKIHTIAPNRLEAEVLTGIHIDSDDNLKAAGDFLLNKGIKQVFITLGADGLYVANETESHKLSNIKGELVNATGAGDAMMAGFAYASSMGLDLKGIGRAGLAAASIAIEGSETINDQMSVEELMKRVNA